MAKASASTPSFDNASLQATSETAIEVLAKAGDSAEALVDAWVRAGNAEAVLAASEQAQGKARKAARRGLNVLKARGVSLPEARRVVSVSGKKEAETHEAWLMAPDGSGTSLVVIAARSPASRYRAIFVFLAPNVGIMQVRQGEMSHSQLRESMHGALRGGRYRPVPVPVVWARYRVADARRIQKERGIAEPLGFAGSESLLGDGPLAPVEHPFDSEGLVLGEDDVKEQAAKSSDLHTLPEFNGWLPPKSALDEMLGKIGEQLTPGEKPDPERFDQLLRAEILAATDRHFTPERRAELVTMMKDSALSVLSRDGEVRALDVVAAMQAIERCGLITDPPHEVPFLRAFFEKAVGVLLAQGNGQLRVPVPRLPGTEGPTPTA